MTSVADCALLRYFVIEPTDDFIRIEPAAANFIALLADPRFT